MVGNMKCLAGGGENWERIHETLKDMGAIGLAKDLILHGKYDDEDFGRLFTVEES